MDNYVYDAIKGYFNIIGSGNHVTRQIEQVMFILLSIDDLLYHDDMLSFTSEQLEVIEDVFENMKGSTCITPFANIGISQSVSSGRTAEEVLVDNVTSSSLSAIRNRLDIIENSYVVAVES